MNHPDQSEWMGWLYGEIEPKQKTALDAHLRDCSACSAQVESWRSSIRALDDWKVAAVRQNRQRWMPTLQWPATWEWAPAMKWAAAVVILLAFGFLAGRQTTASKADVTALKTSLNELAQTLRNENAANQSNLLFTSTSAVNSDALRLVTEYARMQQQQRAGERESLNATLTAFDARLKKMRTDLETVALNTETGFELTDENLTRVASLTLADKN